MLTDTLDELQRTARQDNWRGLCQTLEETIVELGELDLKMRKLVTKVESMHTVLRYAMNIEGFDR